MRLTAYTIYKYIRTDKGWRYCKPAFKNGKIKQDIVLVRGKEEHHPEGFYYLNVDGHWEKVSENAAEAVKQRSKCLAKQQYERTTGEALPVPESKGELLLDAIDAHLAKMELDVAGRNKRPRTLGAYRQALHEFSEQSGVKYVSDVTALVISKHMSWVVEHSPTKSARTARNKYLLILNFLKRFGAVPMAGAGKSARPIGMNEAPKFVEKPVEIYSNEDLTNFFFLCNQREAAVFQTLHRAGLRETELTTLRRQDCRLDGSAPFLNISERPEYGFVPKWYAIRKVNIDPVLVNLLRDWLKTHEFELVFPTPLGAVDGHILRLCKRVAQRARLNPKDWHLHKFRSTFATHCLRKGMDLETLREQLGHRDTESLRRYIKALKSDDRAEKVNEVWRENPAETASSEGMLRVEGDHRRTN